MYKSWLKHSSTLENATPTKIDLTSFARFTRSPVERIFSHFFEINEKKKLHTHTEQYARQIKQVCIAVHTFEFGWGVCVLTERRSFIVSIIHPIHYVDR